MQDNAPRKVDLSKLNPPETAPQDGRQIVGWAIPCGRRDDAEAQPRWCVVQWLAPYGVGAPFWSWSVPGYGASVKLLGWLDLPWSDEIAEHAVAVATKRSAAKEAEGHD